VGYNNLTSLGDLAALFANKLNTGGLGSNNFMPSLKTLCEISSADDGRA